MKRADYAGQYDKKARELKGRQNEIALRIEQHQEGEGDYRTWLCCETKPQLRVHLKSKPPSSS
jgi:hypothetical protein